MPRRGTSGGRPLATLLLPMKGQPSWWRSWPSALVRRPGRCRPGPPRMEQGRRHRPAGNRGARRGDGRDFRPGCDRSARDRGDRSADLTVVASVPAGSHPLLEISDKGLAQKVSLVGGQLAPGPEVLARAAPTSRSASGDLPGAEVHLSDASLVWFAGSDGGTVPPAPDEAYLQVLATASPAGPSFLPASDFSLSAAGRPARGRRGAARRRPRSHRRRVLGPGLVQRRHGDGVGRAGARSACP